MSACTSVPAFGPIGQWRPRKLSTLRGSEKFSFGFLLLSLVICIATRGAVGAELLAVAILCSFFLLPLEYVAVSLVLGPLLPTVLGALPPWYVDRGRWFLIFGGTAVIWFRIRQSRQASRRAPVSLFRSFYTAHVVVAGATVLISTSPSLSGAKWAVLLAALVIFWSYSQWLVRAKGGSAAAIWVRGWLFVLLAARADEWQRGYQSFRESPLLGMGFGVTAVEEEHWDLQSFRYLKVEQGSSLSALLGQVGLFGSAPIYLGIVWLLLRSLHYARRVRDPWLSGVVAAGFVGFINSFFEGWLAAPASGLYWFVVFQLFFLDAVMSNLKPPGRPSAFPRIPNPRAGLRYQANGPYSHPADHRPAGHVNGH